MTNVVKNKLIRYYIICSLKNDYYIKIKLCIKYFRCIVGGWGRDSFNGNFQNIAKAVEVPVVAYADCQTRLRATPRLGPNFNLDSNSFLCAGGEAGRDACTVLYYFIIHLLSNSTLGKRRCRAG